MEKKFDIVIRDGFVLDGAGNPCILTDIGIKNGKIAYIGTITSKGDRTINARGLFISPGFIDAHNHIDQAILAYPKAENYIRQGVTTSVVGNCGMSMAPINRQYLDYLKQYLTPFLAPNYNYRWDWSSLKEYYQRVEEKGIILNLAPLVGFGTTRLAVKGFNKDRLTEEEVKQIKQIIFDSLDNGAFGLSTGLIYPPGSYTYTDELINITSVLREGNGIYSTHIRSEGRNLINSVKEAIRIGERNNIPVEISHHKAVGESNWGKVKETLYLMEEARARGVEVNCDVYPYTAAMTTITSLLPTWVMENGINGMLQFLKTKEGRRAIEKDIEEDKIEGENWIKEIGWNNVVIGECQPAKKYEGVSLQEIINKKGYEDDPFTGFFEWLLEIKSEANMILFGMDESDVEAVISSPLSSIVSDSWLTTSIEGGKPHPRAYGSFPRVIAKYVREKNILSLENAIRKMTSLPAGKMRIKDRGLIKENYWADIVIFDYGRIEDKATFNAPHQYPAGILYVIVNGKLVVEDGKMLNELPGKVLRKR